MTTSEIQALFKNPAPIEPLVLETLANDSSFSLPKEYFAFLQATDGGSLVNGKASFYSISNRLVSGERFYELNNGQNPKLVLIGHYTTQMSEEDFGFLKDRADASSSAVYVQLEETDEIMKIADSFDELLTLLSTQPKPDEMPHPTQKRGFFQRLFRL